MSAQDKPETTRSIGQYQISKELVRQPVSTIYLAQHQEEEHQVFLVVLQPTAPKAEEWIGRFHRRLETISQLDHPLVGHIVDSGSTAEGDAFAAITYEEGRFLSESLPQLSTTEAPMDPVAALKLVRQIAEALTVAHPNGIIHHDLRPQNIFIRQDSTPLLIDLVVPIVRQTALDYQQNTPTMLDYLSPEQQAGKSLSGRSNIFSLGIILYRLLAGHRPKLPVSEWDIFEHKGQPREIPLIEVRSGLRAETYEVVNSCLWQKEWSRYETVDKLIQAIDKAIEAEEAGPPPPPLWMQLWNQHQQRLKIGVPAFIILLLLIVAFLLMRSRQAGNDSPNAPTEAPTTLPVDNSSSSLEKGNAASSSSTETSTVLAASATSPSPTNTITAEIRTTDEASETGGTVTSSVMPEQVKPTVTGTETAVATTTAIVTNTAVANSDTCVVSPLFGWQQYTIQANDTLSTLAQQTEITVEQLREVNCLESNLLSIGQKIWLPALATPTATATATATVTLTSEPPPANPPRQPPAPTAPPPPPTLTPPPP